MVFTVGEAAGSRQKKANLVLCSESIEWTQFQRTTVCTRCDKTEDDSFVLGGERGEHLDG